jgi:hypothetical protein
MYMGDNAWKWLRSLPDDITLIFSRQTQLGLLRLLTNRPAMGEYTLTLGKAWAVYDRWLDDPRVELYPEPRDRKPASGRSPRRLPRWRLRKWWETAIFSRLRSTITRRL